MRRTNPRSGYSADRHPGWRRQVGAVVVLALVAGAVVWWSAGDDDDGSQTATALAHAIATGDFSAVPLLGTTPDEAARQRSAAYDGLGPGTPEVRAGDPVADDHSPDAVTVDLHVAWDLGDSAEDWTYTTRADLERADGTWRVRWSTADLAPDLTPEEHLVLRRLRPERARVLGAHDEVLVESRPVWRVGVDKTTTTPDQVDAAARSLAAALGLDVEAYAARVAATGDRAFVEAIVLRSADPGYDVAALSEIPGVVALPSSLPLAPTRTFARPLLGTVGEATAEVVEASEGAVATGDLTGLSGLQEEFDAQLRGEPGVAVLASADTGDRELYRVDARAGEPLRLTLDPAVQRAAEDVLSGVTGTASALVAVRASTGEVLAAASGPGGDGTSTATLGLFAPGSTFKVASSLALLRSGLDPDSVVPCPATATVAGRTFRNYPDYPASALGDISLRTAVAQSCNTAFLGLADRAPQQALADAAAALGLASGADLGFAAALGSVPVEDAGTEHAASMIGQGRVQASPLGLATVAASVVAGHRVTPRLLIDAPAAEPVAQPLTEQEAGALRSMMRAVVTDGGATFLRDVPGPDVIAKSGTAQYGTDEVRNHAWMIAGYGDLAVSVFVETGDYGSTTSGPLLEAFLRAVPQ